MDIKILWQLMKKLLIRIVFFCNNACHLLEMHQNVSASRKRFTYWHFLHTLQLDNLKFMNSIEYNATCPRLSSFHKVILLPNETQNPPSKVSTNKEDLGPHEINKSDIISHPHEGFWSCWTWGNITVYWNPWTICF